MTANVAVNILDRDGNNLAGVNVPGSSPTSTYPGDAAPVPLAAAHTRDFEWLMPASFGSVTNVSFTVRVTSDQPITVGSNFQFNGAMPNQCSLLPK